jgi:predicted transcriptional regulator
MESKVLTARFDGELVEWLETQAKLWHTSIANIMRQAVVEKMKREEKETTNEV